MGVMELRPYQEEARQAVQREWDQGNRRTLLVLPTGGGKTIIFSKVIEDQVRAGRRVLILAHRGELLQQAADKLRQATGLGCAVEKAEETCLGSWFRVTVGRCRACSGPSAWTNSPRTISALLWWTRPTTPWPRDTSGCWSISPRQGCWA